MANNDNIGPKRLVVGAHYGAIDWLAQRVTGVVMIAYTIILLVLFLTAHNFSYEGWAGLFAHQWFKLATFVLFAALLYHAWIGVRNIWMDYINQSAALRLVLEGLSIVWLVACAGWAAQILWRT